MTVLMKSKTGGEKSFESDVAQKILCYQLRKSIKGDKAWHLSSGFEYKIIDGESCCGGKGKLVINKVSISKKKL